VWDSTKRFSIFERSKFTPLNLQLHKIAYKSACMADRPEMFGPTRGSIRGTDPCCHGNDIYAIGAESSRLPPACVCVINEV